MKTKEKLKVVQEGLLKGRTEGRQISQRLALGRFDHSALVHPVLETFKKISGQTADR